MNQRWRLLALWLLPIGVVLLIGWQVVSNGGINGLNQSNSGGNSPTVAPPQRRCCPDELRPVPGLRGSRTHYSS